MARKPSTLERLAKVKPADVIATREYQLVAKDGTPSKVVLRFARPRPLPEPVAPGAYCVYQIEGLPERTAAVSCPGMDAVQALYMAMNLSWVDLVTTDAYREGRLTFWGIPDLGLPSATYERHLEEIDRQREKVLRDKPPTMARRRPSRRK